MRPSLITAVCIILFSLLMINPESALSEDKTPDSEDTYIAKFNGGGITLRKLNETIKEIKAKRGIPLTGDYKKNILNSLIAESMIHKYATEQGLDRDPEVIEQIEKASRQIITSIFLRKYFSEKTSTITGEEAKRFYSENIDRYSVPEMYNAIIYYVNKKDISGNDTPDKSATIAGELKRYLDEGNAKGGSAEETLSVFAEKYPEANLEHYILAGYWRGKNTVVRKSVLERLPSLEPGQADIIEQDNSFAVFVLQSIAPAEPNPFELVKNKIIAQYEASQKSKVYSELIKKLSSDYNLKVDESLLNR
jgi:EpsD family peptidyl-prolyl cis-trans isomerase